MIAQSSIRAEHFEFDLSELQGLFLKGFTIVGESAYKFFGRQSNTDAENIIVLRWESPKGFCDERIVQVVQEALENAFRAVELQLRVIV